MRGLAAALALRLGLWGPLLGLVLVPLGSFLVYGLFSTEGGQIRYAPTLQNYLAVFTNQAYFQTFVKTLLLALQVTLLCFLLGYAVAYFIWRRRGRLRHGLLLALAVPLMMSYIIKIYAMRGILGTNGLLNQLLLWLGLVETPVEALLFNLTAVRITLVVVLLPFMALPIFVALERIPGTLLQASADLGAGPAQTFLRVVLPLSLPGSMVGAMFTFVLAVGDFLAPELVGGVQGFTYGRLVFSQFGLAFNWPLGAALSALLLVTALLVIVLANRLGNPPWQR